MGVDGPADRTVHPFFTALKERGISQPPNEQDDAKTDATSHTTDNDVAGKENIPAAGEEEPKKKRRGRKRKSDEDSLHGPVHSQPKLSFAPQRNHATEAHEDTPRGATIAPAVTDVEALEENPPKRQKSESSAPTRAATPDTREQEPVMGWEEQLVQAGFAGSSPPKEQADTHHLASTNPVNLSIQDTHEATGTSTKRVIRIRSDGRLVSPKVNKIGLNPKNNIEIGPTANRKQMLVVLKYTSDSDPTCLGQKIQDILSGRLKSTVTTGQTVAPAASQPRQQPKVIHSFFTSRMPGNKSAAVKGAELENTGARKPRDRSSSPKRAAPSSKSWVGFGASFSKPPKVVGTLAAAWPSRETLHVRGLPEQLESYKSPLHLQRRRLKDSEIRLQRSEDILTQTLLGAKATETQKGQSRGSGFHRPRRRLMTGPELQNAVRESLSHSRREFLIRNHGVIGDDQGALRSVGFNARLKDPIDYLYDRLGFSFSTFDMFECEQREWNHKYAPKKVDHVLCGSSDMPLLREWLVGLTVNAVESKSADGQKNKIKSMKLKRKRRKAKDDLDGFIVSEDSDHTEDSENEDVDTQVHLPRISTRSITKAKAVVLHGPHGCGKTASVFAVANELGFEVFELNSGMRRSGRDIIDRVGDMTRNHIVGKSDVPPEEKDTEAPASLHTEADIESGRQSTMASFFQTTGKAKKPTKLVKANDTTALIPPKKASRKQKQSLILLEEVDVLFDEDKHFWATVLSMLLESRRPIIMTCTEESLLPVQDMVDVVALKMNPAPASDVIDYLLLLAASEGHLIARAAMEELLEAHSYDLRATIIQLNFLCQMALGDSKGGLDWMLIRSNTEECQNERGEQLRVISEDTFVEHMPIVLEDRLRTRIADETRLKEDVYTLADMQSRWTLNFEAPTFAADYAPALASLDALRRFDQAAEALSAADIMPGSSFFEPSSVLLDPEHPLLSEKERASYPEGRPLLDSPVWCDYSDQSLHIALSLKLQARILLGDSKPLDAAILSTYVLTSPVRLSDVADHHAASLASALSPLSIPPPSNVFTNSSYRPSPSLLPSTSAKILASDFAPFLRNIVAADLKLEQERLRLSGLLSQGSRDGKRARTTRAARAALEGGRKENTRKERWFGHEVNYQDILATAAEAFTAAGEREALRREAVSVEEQTESIE